MRKALGTWHLALGTWHSAFTCSCLLRSAHAHLTSTQRYIHTKERVKEHQFISSSPHSVPLRLLTDVKRLKDLTLC